MATIKIKPKRSYSVTEFLFGCSLTDNEASVSNWKDGINTFDVEDGTWFCFAKKKNSGRVSKVVKIVNCGQICTVNYVDFRKRLSCTITGIKPYIKIGSTCQITGISPYIKVGGGITCQITGIKPYIKTAVVIQEPVAFTGINSITI